MTHEQLYGVRTGTTSYLIELAPGAPSPFAVLETPDGMTHHIRIVERTQKWLRYALRHDNREYLLANNCAKLVSANTAITCMTCLARGVEDPDDGEEP